MSKRREVADGMTRRDTGVCPRLHISEKLHQLDYLPPIAAGHVLLVQTDGEYDDGTEWRQSAVYYPVTEQKSESSLVIGRTEHATLRSLGAGAINYSIYDILLEHGYKSVPYDADFVTTTYYKYRRRMGGGVRRSYDIQTHLQLEDGAISYAMGHIACGDSIPRYVKDKGLVLACEGAFNELDVSDTVRVDNAVAWLQQSVLE